MLFDIILLIIFFIVYQLAGIFFATAILVMGVCSVLLASLIMRKRLSMSTWLTMVIVLLFGGATLLFHNARFIQWKPTILYWLFALVLWGSVIFGGKNLIKAAMFSMADQAGDPPLQLPDSLWHYINNSYATFFFCLGILNIIIVYCCTESIWVDFKIYGLLPITILFMILQALSVYFYMKGQKTADLSRQDNDKGSE